MIDNVKDFLDEAKNTIEEGYIIAALTDEYIVDYWPSEKYQEIVDREELVLEIRVFDNGSEMKISRGNIGSAFKERRISDKEKDMEKIDIFDEVQYLDIDDTKEMKDRMVKTTGGGKFKLPLNKKENAKIRIRYYLGKYERTGQARVEDWRVVGFEEGE